MSGKWIIEDGIPEMRPLYREGALSSCPLLHLGASTFGPLVQILITGQFCRRPFGSPYRLEPELWNAPRNNMAPSAKAWSTVGIYPLYSGPVLALVAPGVAFVDALPKRFDMPLFCPPFLPPPLSTRRYIPPFFPLPPPLHFPSLPLALHALLLSC